MSGTFQRASASNTLFLVPTTNHHLGPPSLDAARQQRWLQSGGLRIRTSFSLRCIDASRAPRPSSWPLPSSRLSSSPAGILVSSVLQSLNLALHWGQSADILRYSQSSGPSSQSDQPAFEPPSSSSAGWPYSSSESHSTMLASAPPTPACRPSSSTLRRPRPSKQSSRTPSRRGSSARSTSGPRRRTSRGCRFSRAWAAGFD